MVAARLADVGRRFVDLRPLVRVTEVLLGELAESVALMDRDFLHMRVGCGLVLDRRGRGVGGVAGAGGGRRGNRRGRGLRDRSEQRRRDEEQGDASDQLPRRGLAQLHTGDPRRRDAAHRSHNLDQDRHSQVRPRSPSHHGDQGRDQRAVIRHRQAHPQIRPRPDPGTGRLEADQQQRCRHTGHDHQQAEQ